jgi:hypothetical protein
MITRPKGALSWAVSLLALAVTATAQTPPQPQPAPQSAFAALISIYLARDASGHSPSVDDIAGIAALNPPPESNAVHEAVPLLLKALADPDVPLHTFALTALTGLQAQPTAPPAQPNVPQPPPGPLYYKPEIAKQLAPIIPQIAAHLADDAQSDRLLAANVLGGFTPDPPAAVFPPLIAYLKRDDAISQVGFVVVTDLLQLGVTDEVATAITRYLARRDQTSESRSNLADLIASNPHQSQAINHSLLAYLDSDDNSLRARVILSLPQMDLAPGDFATAQSRVNILATNPNENLQVINAAKSVTGCWTAVKMVSGCPVY